MKKLLGIVVLGLLLSGNTYTEAKNFGITIVDVNIIGFISTSS